MTAAVPRMPQAIFVWIIAFPRGLSASMMSGCVGIGRIGLGKVDS